MLKHLYDAFIAFFKTPSREDGYKHAKQWIEDGIYAPDDLGILSDGTFDNTDFDRGINDYLFEHTRNKNKCVSYSDMVQQ
jgi:hypothetical protein